MQRGEIRDIRENHPFMFLVLEQISNGEKIENNSPFYESYLLARQRGFVKRVGITRKKIVVSERGEEFMKRRKE